MPSDLDKTSNKNMLDAYQLDSSWTFDMVKTSSDSEEKLLCFVSCPK